MAEGGAALPWGAPAHALAADAVDPLADSDLHAISMEQLGLEAGARIEVIWKVSMDDEGEESDKWFPATLSYSTPAQQQQQQQAASAAAAAGAAAPTADSMPSSSTSPPAAAASSTQSQQELRYTLTYDGNEDFPEEVTTVLLLSDHGLYDIEKSEIMVWRRVGDSYEPDEEGDPFDPRELDVSEEDAAAGEAAMLARLSDMTQSESGKAYVMAGYKDFKDQFKAFIAAKAACAEGSDLLITTSDVQEFTAMMKTQRATSAAHRH